MRNVREPGARRTGQVLGYLTVSAMLAACPAVPTVERELAEGCLVNTDCREPLVCAFRRCHNACKTDRDCPRGLHCRSADKPLNVCMLDDELLCPGGRDRECPAEMVCGPDLVCRDACRTDRDCLADQSCVQGVCANPAEVVDGGLPINPQGVVRCVLNSDCSSPLVCRTGGCVRECRENRDCALGAFCADAGLCASGEATRIAALTPERVDAGVLTVGYGDPCVVNSDCRNTALRCLSGRCGVECFEARDCNASLSQCCTPLNRCASGPACIPPDAGLFDPPTPDGGCRNDADCQDTVRCNGAERCIDRRCRAAEKAFCDDGNPCSLDMCSEVGPPCSYTSVRTDVDGDGRFPVACGGSADDCDDNDANTYPGAPEKCDFKDNNCNGAFDETLWRVKAGSRGPLTTGGEYLPGSGRPQALLVGGRIVLVAASDRVRGTIDAWQVDPVTLSPSAGPVAVGGSSTAWRQCGSTFGKQAGFPQVATDGTNVMVTGIERSYSDATCCLPGEPGTNSAFFRLISSGLSVLDGGTLRTSRSTASSCTSELALWQSVVPPSSAPVGAEWAFVWADTELPSDTVARVLRRTWRPGQGFTQDPLLVFPFNANRPASLFGTTASTALDLRFERTVRVARNSEATFIGWTNPATDGLGLPRRLRYIIYSADLSRVLHGPFDLASPGRSSYPSFGPVFGRDDGFAVMTHGIRQFLQSFDLLHIGQDGGVQQRRSLTFTDTTPGSIFSSGTITAGEEPAAAFVDGGLFLAVTDFASAGSDRLRFVWTPDVPDAGTQSVTLELGQDFSKHTDFALVPVSARSVAAFWQDGDIQKVAFECQDQ